jgi:F420-non-reducing hydrogenase iron-sulfur subunit
MEEEYRPRIVGFLCNWCAYAGADLAGVSRLKYPSGILPIRVMCSSRVDPLHILTALISGADGVLVAGCHPGDCHYQQGNYRTRRRFAVLKRILENLGLESDRVRLSWVSASEGRRFAQVVEDFTRKIQELGPTPCRGEPFL